MEVTVADLVEAGGDVVAVGGVEGLPGVAGTAPAAPAGGPVIGLAEGVVGVAFEHRAAGVDDGGDAEVVREAVMAGAAVVPDDEVVDISQPEDVALVVGAGAVEPFLEHLPLVAVIVVAGVGAVTGR